MDWRSKPTGENLGHGDAGDGLEELQVAEKEVI